MTLRALCAEMMRGTDLYGPGIGFLGLGDRNDERNDALNNFSDLLFF